MTVSPDFDPDAYIEQLFARHDDLGAAYVRRQVEWAESILKERMALQNVRLCDTAQPVAA
jgi:hypothetical protein